MADATKAPAGEHEIEVLSSDFGMSKMERAEIDMQITTAHAYPRQLAVFKRMALEMVTLNPETAAECFYTLKRKDKDGRIVKIEGGSIRLAEIVACTWGNMRAGQRVSDIDDRYIYGQGFAHDLETNLKVTVEVSRRITGSSGRRYGDDMIGVTGNAAAAIAYRNAVLKVVPKALWLPLYEQARQLARGDMKSLETRRKEMLIVFAKLKVTEKMICDYLEIKGTDDIGLDELLDLRGVYTAISNGDTTVANAFSPTQEDTPEPRRASEAKDNVQPMPPTPIAGAPPAPTRSAPTGEPMADATDALQVFQAAMYAGFSQKEIKLYLLKHYGNESVQERFKKSEIAALIDEFKAGGKPDPGGAKK